MLLWDNIYCLSKLDKTVEVKKHQHYQNNCYPEMRIVANTSSILEESTGENEEQISL